MFRIILLKHNVCFVTNKCVCREYYNEVAYLRDPEQALILKTLSQGNLWSSVN